MSYLILAEGFARLLDSPNLSCFFMQHADLFRAPGWMLRSRRRQRMFFFCAGVHGIKRMASHLQNINLQILLQKQYDIRYLIEKMLEKKTIRIFEMVVPFLGVPLPSFSGFFWGVFFELSNTHLAASRAPAPWVQRYAVRFQSCSYPRPYVETPDESVDVEKKFPSQKVQGEIPIYIYHLLPRTMGSVENWAPKMKGN